MKSISKVVSVAILFAVLTVTANADKFDDLYKEREAGVVLAIQASIEIGTWGAYAAGQMCEGYINGFAHGNYFNSNSNELESQRYSDWNSMNRPLEQSTLDYMSKRDLQNAAASAFLYFENGCKYRTILLRETAAKVN